VSAGAVPTLPGGVGWVRSGVEAASLVKAGVVPLLLPADRTRAQRWARVLHAYGAVSLLTPDESRPDKLLVSVGDSDEFGQVAAAALGRVHHHVPDLRAVSALKIPGEASVVLVAPAMDCTFAGLHPILRCWHNDGVSAGVLTGLDMAGMSFTLAKILADRHGTAARPHADVHLDGTTGHAVTNGGEHLPLAEALSASWRCVVLDAHGTGSHVTLGSFILCGLSGDRERTLDGRAVVGGCAGGHCRVGRNVLEQVLVRDLWCRTMALFVCNGITLDPEEQYPSDVALAHAVLEGFPASILGLFRQDTETSATESTAAAHLLAAGVPNGTVTAWLSQDAASRGYPSAYLLLGEPEHSHPAATPPTALVPWPQRRQPALPAIVDHAGQPVSAVLTHDGVISPSHAVEPLRVWDASTQVSTTVEELARWVTDCDEASHLEDALEALMSPTSKRRAVLSDCLARMRHHRLTARQLALDGIRTAQTYRRSRRGAPTAAPLPELRDRALGWATALNDSMAARAGAFRLWEALEAHHTADLPSSGSACPRCGAPLTRLHLASPVPGLGDRVSLTCPRCGPRAHSPAPHAIDVRGPAQLRRGGTAKVHITPTLPCQARESGFLSVHLQERTGLRTLAQRSCPARPGEEHTLSVPVPPDLPLDLHRIWVLWVHRLRVSVLQLRLPTQPDLESLPAPASGTRTRP
jgi:hypothetical protein